MLDKIYVRVKGNISDTKPVLDQNGVLEVERRHYSGFSRFRIRLGLRYLRAHYLEIHEGKQGH